MTNESPTPQPPESGYDLWFGRIRLLVIQGLGAAGITYEFFLAEEVQPLLLASAMVLAGVPITRILEKMLK